MLYPPPPPVRNLYLTVIGFFDNNGVFLPWPSLLYEQNNLLVRDPSQRLSFPLEDSTRPTNIAFFFHSSDLDRVIVVDLGRTRRVRDAGAELCAATGISFEDAVGR